MEKGKNKNIVQWATIYRGLGNPNRLRILKLLRGSGELSVSELSEKLGISFKNTSRNAKILLDLDLVEFQGREGRVYYRINSKMAENIKKILDTTFR